MNRVSASGLERWLACAFSRTAPQVKMESSPAAAEGTAIHAFLDQIARGVPRDEALTQVPEEYRPRCALIDTDKVPRGDVLTEQAYAYSLKTGHARAIDVRDRGYPGEERVVYGTADLVKPPGGGEPAEVWDYKTGMGALKPPGEAEQLLFFALCLGDIYGPPVRVGCVRVGPMGGLYPESATVDAFDLAVFRKRLERSFDPSAERLALEGAWCQYCPSWDWCPPKTALLRLMAQLRHGDAGEVTSAQAASDAYALRKEMASWMRRVEARLHAVVRDLGPLDVGGGKVWGPRSSSRRTVVGGAQLVQALAEELGEHAPPMEGKVSLKALAAAAKSAGVKRDAVLEVLAEKGLVKLATSETWREYQPGQDDQGDQEE